MFPGCDATSYVTSRGNVNLDLSDKPPKDRRMLAIGMAVGSAAALTFAVLSKSWMTRSTPVEIGFGPLGCRGCALGGGDMSNGALVDLLRTLGPEGANAYWWQLSSLVPKEAARAPSGAFAPVGYITFGLSVIAVLGLLGAAFLALRKMRPQLPVSPASAALLGIMGALITGCVFVATKPGPQGLVGVAIGFWAFAAGCVLGIVAAQMIAKVIRPADPDLLEGAMTPDAY